MKFNKIACLGLVAIVALGALGCGSDNKAADKKSWCKSNWSNHWRRFFCFTA